MTDTKRTFQDSSVNQSVRLDAGAPRAACMGCPGYVFPVCRETGEDILYPVSGPVGFRCPLPVLARAEEGDEDEYIIAGKEV